LRSETLDLPVADLGMAVLVGPHGPDSREAISQQTGGGRHLRDNRNRRVVSRRICDRRARLFPSRLCRCRL